VLAALCNVAAVSDHVLPALVTTLRACSGDGVL
jgi:hypothetical protein